MTANGSTDTEHLRDLFVERTGTTTLTESQIDEETGDRLVMVDRADGTTVAEVVAETALENGLDDVIDDADWGGE